MATIAENLQTILDSKAAIKAAIESKGVTDVGNKIADYAGKIESIESGGVTVGDVDPDNSYKTLTIFLHFLGTGNILSVSPDNVTYTDLGPIDNSRISTWNVPVDTLYVKISGGTTYYLNTNVHNLVIFYPELPLGQYFSFNVPSNVSTQENSLTYTGTILSTIKPTSPLNFIMKLPEPSDIVNTNNYGIYAAGATFSSVSHDVNNVIIWSYEHCVIKGTLITLIDGTKKPVEDITFDDDILVWNFYKGCFDAAKPLFIKTPQLTTRYNLCTFSNGTKVGFVGEGGTKGYHRIFNADGGSFTYTGNIQDTPIGTRTFYEDHTYPTLISQEIIEEPIEYYNVITDTHYNLFANGILTSMHWSNQYDIDSNKMVYLLDKQNITEDTVKEEINKMKENKALWNTI